MKVISRRTNYLLLLGVVLLVVIPLIFVKGEYGGSDAQGTAAVVAARPGYKPWFTPIWVPPSPEIESLLVSRDHILSELDGSSVIHIDPG